jgi:antitoxin (DNA-binding transcriptional repressor) of toxin-antitoxin stability system
MRTVEVAELKKTLSTYIAYAKSGEQIVIREDNRPVAWLLPIAADDLSEHEVEMVASGQMTLPKQPRRPEAFFKLPIPTVEDNAGTQAILDDREESL